MASGGPSDPGSWNRYSYVEGDPVNAYDPVGTFMCAPTVIMDGSSDFVCGQGRGVNQTPTYVGCAADYYVTTSGPNDCYGMDGSAWQYLGKFWTGPTYNNVPGTGAQHNPGLCPLVGLTATNYTLQSDRTHAIFTQAMASELDAALGILARQNITVQINFGFRTIAENATLNPPGAVNSNHCLLYTSDAADE